MGSSILRGEARAKISRAVWRKRKREGGKATCQYCLRPIFAGGVKYREEPYHKSCFAFMKRGFALEQVLNPKNQKIIDRINQLYKKDRQNLTSIIKRYYSVIDTKGTPKAVLVSMILEAEFGRKAFEEHNKNP